MENIINYFYNLFPETIKNSFGGFLFQVEEKNYLLVEIVSEKEIANVYQLLMQNKIGNYILVNNKDKKVISEYEDKKYLLFYIRCNFNETIMFNETLNINTSGNNIWSKIWGDRIDYYEIQINELGQDKHIVLSSIYYYIGLAENAIAIADKFETQLDQNDYSIQHYRMNVPVLKGDYYNPNNMLVDISIRDIAEYIKSSFFSNMKDQDFYLDYIFSLNLDNKKANLLLARLLYPSYYFDIFDEVILNERDEHDLIEIIKENERFEYFIKRIYFELSKRFQMVNIDWIKKGATAPH